MKHRFMKLKKQHGGHWLSGENAPGGVFSSSLRVVLGVALFFAAGAIYAQDRSALSVYVPMPTGGTAAEREYFLEQFKMELIGANYPSVESKAASAYTLNLSIKPNDGFDSSKPAGDTNRPWSLGISLMNSKTDEEVVSFNFAYVNTDQMADWNLYLLYQALANAYSGDSGGGSGGGVIDDRWCNQIFYINVGVGVSVASFLKADDNRITAGFIYPTGVIGFELHFLNFMSIEIPIRPHVFENTERVVYSIAADFLLKGVIKPQGVMIEIYAGAEGAYGLMGAEVPLISVVGGIQVGFRGARRSAWTLDFGASKNLVGGYTNPTGDKLGLIMIHMLVGYKWGFGDNKKYKTTHAAPAAEESY